MTENDHKSVVQRQFGRSACAYSTSEVHAAGESLKLLLELVSPKPHWHGLDIATGAGHTAILFAPHIQQITATDITRAMLDATKELANQKGISNLRTEVADAEQLPIADGSMNLVTCRLAFHHFQQQNRALAEVFRVLKPGGVFGFTDNFTVNDGNAADFYNLFETIRDPSHFLVHSLDGISTLFHDAGFTIESTRLLSKEFEFHNWADRQHVNDADKNRLLKMLDQVPRQLTDLLKPRKTNETCYFSLAEAVIIARKPADSV